MQQGYKPSSSPGVLYPHDYIRHSGFLALISLIVYVSFDALVRVSHCRTVNTARIHDWSSSESIEGKGQHARRRLCYAAVINRMRAQ